MYIRFWGGTFSHTSNTPKPWASLSNTLLKLIIPLQSVFVRTQLKSSPMNIVGEVNAASEFHIVKVFFLLSDELDGAYTGCNRRNGPDLGRVFLRSNYTDITKRTYIQS